MTGRYALLLITPALAAFALSGCGAGTADPPTASPASATASEMASSSASPVAPSADGADTVTLAFVVADGKATPKATNQPVPLGSDVVLTVTSDVADEIHVHGYDEEENVDAGGTVTIDFTADQKGTFEVETHESGLLLVKLVVS
jgi:glucose/arabinose dehydrogenase